MGSIPVRVTKPYARKQRKYVVSEFFCFIRNFIALLFPAHLTLEFFRHLEILMHFHVRRVYLQCKGYPAKQRIYVLLRRNVSTFEKQALGNSVFLTVIYFLTYLPTLFRRDLRLFVDYYPRCDEPISVVFFMFSLNPIFRNALLTSCVISLALSTAFPPENVISSQYLV